ncbi:hypothetical protein K2173_012190 [Erythroxylum novogranatense]|uniref:Peptidase A1 domain-containing protein n=1 Tax=Erythroxylum novogranatense TaxID=1862640 RepID=A0AAV8T954_9ROSI|nr:hypothetical protein K2173_012190 [Erythroxylum novogranatense]
MASFNTFALLFTLSTLCLSNFNLVDAERSGFSIQLYHRESPESPFYDPNATPSQHLADAFRRSNDRFLHFFGRNTASPRSRLISNGGEYLTKISIGTPPFEITAIADTGSDLIWTQCKPCTDCYKQDDPFFNPGSSTTYRDIPCGSTACNYLEDPFCSSRQVCQYEYRYGDQSYTRGDIASDTVTLSSTSGRPVPFPKITIGCGHKNNGTFDKKGSGIIGLGGGELSLIYQLDKAIDGKFAYCLVPLTSKTKNSSTLSFGADAIVSGKGASTTPLIAGDPNTFYYLNLESISVGSKKLPFPSSTSGSSDGNIVIDSGTTLTLVPGDFFSELASAVDEIAGGTKADDPQGFLDLCYEADPNLKVPTITAHFQGADVKLDQSTIFIQVSEGVVCLAFNPAPSGIGAIFGNLAQANLLIGYDLKERTLSFKQLDCTQY